MARHIPDHECDPCAGQRDDVVPRDVVPRAAGVPRKVAESRLDGILVGQSAWQQAVLQDEGGSVLACVTAGVVQTQCSVRG
jgi:hypothetical protein